MNEERRVVSTRIEQRLRAMLHEEATLRGHTLAEALAKIIDIGLPIYLKRYPKRYQPIEESKQHQAA